MGELETAGFVAKANGLNPATGRRSRVDQYRIRDNYTRFFLRYVALRIPEVEAGVFTFAGMELLSSWDAMMGLQFENLVLSNFAAHPTPKPLGKTYGFCRPVQMRPQFARRRRTGGSAYPDGPSTTASRGRRARIVPSSSRRTDTAQA